MSKVQTSPIRINQFVKNALKVERAYNLNKKQRAQYRCCELYKALKNNNNGGVK